MSENVLDKTAKAVKVSQLTGIFNNLKSQVEVFFAVGLHDVEHPVAGLATDFRRLYNLILSAEKNAEQWLVKEYKGIEDVPAQLQQAYREAMAKLNAIPGAVRAADAVLDAAKAPDSIPDAPAGVVDEIAAAKAAAEGAAPEAQP